MPEASEFYTTCNAFLRHVVWDESRGWTCQDRLAVDYYPSRTAFDFERRKAYYYDPEQRLVQVYGLPSLAPLETHELAPESFPFQSVFGTFVALDARQSFLIIASSQGDVTVVEASTMRVRSRIVLPPLGTVWEVKADQATGELLVLQEYCLSVFRLADMKLVARRLFEDAAYGLATDHDFFFVSFPKAMTIRKIDRRSLETVVEARAPLGVRTMAVDPSRGYLLVSSMSGVVETRWASDLVRVTRARLIPWIHWMEPLPERGTSS
ncbi:MAG: hypothetical protein M5R36_12035 [Deltaproteobacteria bacterium]|nr:hypothetical protein [Deltaproteobacteria bacterium]